MAIPFSPLFTQRPKSLPVIKPATLVASGFWSIRFTTQLLGPNMSGMVVACFHEPITRGGEGNG